MPSWPGVSKYRGDGAQPPLRRQGRRGLRHRLRLAASTSVGTDKVHLTAADRRQAKRRSQPTRANLLKALKEAGRPKPGDVVVVYLAGHGVTQGGPDGD